jgi:hypothetical protein
VERLTEDEVSPVLVEGITLFGTVERKVFYYIVWAFNKDYFARKLWSRWEGIRICTYGVRSFFLSELGFPQESSTLLVASCRI